MIMRYQMAVLLFAGTTAALAAPPVANVWQIYQAELARQCPAKHLEWLAPADIRDALDDYQSHLSTGLQSAMTTAERHSCRDVSAGVTCDNVGDLDIAWKNDLMPAVALRDPHKSALINQHHISVGSGEVIKNSAQHRSS